jgi:hypothetical protein
LEVVHYKKNKKKVDLVTQTFEEVNNSKITNFSLKQVLDEKSKTKFVLYENLLLDVTKYAEDHPGGKNLIKDIFYSDASRYITGNQAFSTKISAHDHNAQTCIYSIKSLAYAKFSDDHKIVQQNNKTAYLNHDMIFEYKSSIADSTSQLVFSKESFKFPIFISGVNWLGRHFAISSSELNKTRYYSICLCLDKKIQERANILLENISNLEKDKNIENPLIRDTELYSNNISFYIKSYDFEKALSLYLHNVKQATSSKINIRGPIVIGNKLIYFLIDIFCK